jgi:hypothetical protein
LFCGFMKHQKLLPVRWPDWSSLSRATAFNRHSESKSYDKFEEDMSRNESFANGTPLWNLEEIGLKIVQK